MSLQNMRQKPVAIPYSGTALLEMSLLNKGSAFSENERDLFRLHGLLPPNIDTIEDQHNRIYAQYNMIKGDLNKHIFLRQLQDRNETLFYHLLTAHLAEMLPILYTPVVGEACEHFSKIYRAHRGVFISYPLKDRIDELLANVTKRNIKVIVVTDSERILGLGDQGIGGMGIPIGKLSIYTACGGISPAYTLPMVLDVGTNNQQLLNDPMYMGWRHPRITGADYENFVDAFITAVKRKWPNVMLQFEDFAIKNAVPLLRKYREKICCFNDDIQGTAVVTLGCLIAASRAVGKKLKDQRVVFLGAGSAGCGIAESIVSRMKSEGLTDQEARARVFMVDRFGLLTDKMPNLLDFQAALAQGARATAAWDVSGQEISLLDTVKNVKPTIMIGASGQPGLFTEEVIKTMHANCPNPIIMPLSNPTSRVEALPSDIIHWTEGQALVATGSPFLPVTFQEKLYPIAQCNNSYIFPGIGLGVLASGARMITDNMMMAASEALADTSPKKQDPFGALLPDLSSIKKVSMAIALNVAKTAMNDDVAAKLSDADLQKAIDDNYWSPEYRTYVPKGK